MGAFILLSKAYKIAKDLLSSIWENTLVRLVLLTVVIIQISSMFAHKAEKAYQKDMEWEKPPDRLPDMVDMQISIQNREAQINRAITKMEKVFEQLGPDPVTGKPPSQQKLWSLLDELIQEYTVPNGPIPKKFSEKFSEGINRIRDMEKATKEQTKNSET